MFHTKLKGGHQFSYSKEGKGDVLPARITDWV
jgi:hypothetical protein